MKINPTLSSARTEAAAIGRTFVHVRQPITSLRSSGPSRGWKTFKTHGETVVKLDNSISAGLESPRAPGIGNKINLESFSSIRAIELKTGHLRTTTLSFLNYHRLSSPSFFFFYISIYLSVRSRNYFSISKERIVYVYSYKKPLKTNKFERSSIDEILIGEVNDLEEFNKLQEITFTINGLPISSENGTVSGTRMKISGGWKATGYPLEAGNWIIKTDVFGNEL